jgi:cytochrome b
MNTPLASPADAPAAESAHTPPLRTVLVWDAPVRVFHWLMVLGFAGAYLTAESERWRLVHVTLGYTMAGLVAFRVLWGFVGTRHARFASFVRGPAAVARYLRRLAGGRAEPVAGHNPAGSLAIVALLGMTVVVTAAGWATYNDIGGGWLEELHEGAASVMLAIVGVHVAGVLLGSWLHRDHLIAAMVTGRKRARPEEALPSARRSVAVLMLAAVLGFWWLQWSIGAPTGAAGDATASVKKHHRDDD